MFVNFLFEILKSNLIDTIAFTAPSFEDATKILNTNLEAGPEQDHKYGWNVVKAIESAQSVE